MRRLIGTLALVLLAPVLSTTAVASGAVTGAADAATSPAARAAAPCYGYVYKLKHFKKDDTVRMKYWIYCDHSVDYIQTRAFLRQGDRFKYARNVCRNTWVCSASARMKDIPGSQLYTVRAVEGGDLADVAYVRNGSHGLWSCGGGAVGWGDPMKCTGAGRYW
ncbi:hypothetical protein [Nocardioides sp.]|uniref:hypothetical protein n=1 Tax=Nocardioides sp. TaxID=35761 RepID=UPI003782DD17